MKLQKKTFKKFFTWFKTQYPAINCSCERDL